MTDYDHFPPIRFRFSGDVEQAKGRIPQARTLMAQLIRRMEGLGRDAGQWQGKMSDGTQFRVAKMGDVHVADIFGVTPSVEQPVTARGVAYDVRMITPGAPMVANPESIIPETVIPEIPDAPHTSPRDILMRPHGERFGNGDYLWVGARLVFPGYSESLYPTDTRSIGVSTQTTKWRDTPGETGDWRKYLNINIEGVVDYTNAGYYEYPTNVSSDIAEIPFIAALPTVNLVLFAPDARQRAIGSVFQTYDYIDYFGATNQYQSSIVGVPAYSDQDMLTWWNTAATAYDDQGWVTAPETGPASYIFNNNVHSARGVYSSDLIYKKENPIPVQAYLCLDAQDPKKTRINFYEPATPALALPIQTSWNQIAAGNDVPVSLSLSGDPSGSYGVEARTITFTGVRTLTDDSSSVETDESSSIQATAEQIQDGFYELRLSAGFNNALTNVSGWVSASCEVFIQLGETLRTYTVTLNATNSYVDAGNFLEYGSGYIGPGTLGGLFNVRGWIESGTPTPMDDTWYQGCWLIDIKNQSVIHETDPANLTRDWFTTE